MFDERIDKIIKSTHKSYCKYVSIIPEITKIETISGNYAEMQFDAKSLYEKNYILKVNESINDENEQFIENILWHEFTHVADSILFNEYEYEDYKHIMYIYSEIHAAELQMNNMLATQMERPCSLEQDIEHKGIITLQKYMDTSLHHALDQFKLPVWYIFLSDNICDAREIYYFIGYLKSLKSHSINYEYSYSDIDERYNSLFKEITEYVLNNQEYDYKHFISLDKQMDKLINKQVKQFYLSRIRKCDLVLVNLEHTNTSIGTAQELQFAVDNHIPIIGFNDYDSYEWLPEDCDVIFKGINEAIDYINDFYLE